MSPLFVPFRQNWIRMTDREMKNIFRLISENEELIKWLKNERQRERAPREVRDTYSHFLSKCEILRHSAVAHNKGPSSQL